MAKEIVRPVIPIKTGMVDALLCELRLMDLEIASDSPNSYLVKKSIQRIMGWLKAIYAQSGEPWNDFGQGDVDECMAYVEHLSKAHQDLIDAVRRLK